MVIFEKEGLQISEALFCAAICCWGKRLLLFRKELHRSPRSVCGSGQKELPRR